MGIVIVLGVVFVIIFGIVFLLLFSVNSTVDKSLQRQTQQAEDKFMPPASTPGEITEQQITTPETESRENGASQHSQVNSRNPSQPTSGSSFALGMGIITLIIAFIIVFMLVNSMHFH